MTTVTNQNTGTPSRLSRLQDAYDYKIKHGWTPLTPEEEVEFHKMVAEFTNLYSMRYLLDTCIMLYMLNKTGEMSDDVEAIVSDYGNRLYICAASVRELVAAWHKHQPSSFSHQTSDLSQPSYIRHLCR